MQFVKSIVSTGEFCDYVLRDGTAIRRPDFKFLSLSTMNQVAHIHRQSYLRHLSLEFNFALQSIAAPANHRYW